MPGKRRLPSIKRLAYNVAERAVANRFAKGDAQGDEILFTYDPTNTTWPGNGWEHPRTSRAGYDNVNQVLAVQFYSNGAVYHYYDVPASVARQFRRTNSPGKFINSVLNGYDYSRIS